MFNTFIVPPKPKKRIVMRRVKSRRCLLTAMFILCLTAILLPLSDTDVSIILLDHQPAWLFWLVVSSASISIIFVFIAIFFLFTEKAKEFILEEHNDSPIIY